MQVYWKILVDGRLVDTALTKKVAMRRSRRQWLK
jgi:hypothetical protein